MSIKIILFYLILASCNNGPKSNSKTSVVEVNSSKNTYDLVSGKYGNISIAIDGKSVTGAYEYYDRWDKKYKAFTDINVFYFSGEFINDSTVTISTAPSFTEHALKGIIIFGSNKLMIKLDEQPPEYSDVNFTQDSGVEMTLKQAEPWIQVRFVKAKKARLYNEPDEATIKKGYFVEEDIVKVLQRAPNDFVKIEYSNPATPGKDQIYWIKEADLN